VVEKPVMSEEYEQPVKSPIEEKEVEHLGRAASSMGFADKGGLNAYLSDLYLRIHKWAVEVMEYDKAHPADKEDKEETK
jgi:hypothetical protein